MQRRIAWVMLVVVVSLAFGWASRAASDAVQSRLLQGFNYVTVGRIDAALSEFLQAAREDGDNPEVHLLVGLAHEANQSYDRALEHYRRGEEQEQNAILATLAGDIYLRQGRLEQAAEEYRRAVALNPEVARAHYGLAMIQEAWGYPDAALDGYQTSVDAAPRLAGAQFRLGRLLRQEGDYDRAMEHLREANRIQPGRPDTHFEMGLTFAAQGEVDRARHAFRFVLQLDPDYTRAERELAELPTE